MTEKEKAKLVAKAIRSYAQEHFGWAAKYHPDDREKWETLMNAADRIEGKTEVRYEIQNS
jgi:hypothetical protein